MKYLYTALIACAMITSAISPAHAVEGAPVAIQNGSKVAFDYTLTVDEKVVESSIGKKPVEFTLGKSNILPALEKELTGMSAGQEKTVTLTPAQGYGIVDKEALKDVPRSSLPKEITPAPGVLLRVKGQDGEHMVVKIVAVKKDKVTIDFNHPLAGKTLNFKVKIVSVD